MADPFSILQANQVSVPTLGSLYFHQKQQRISDLIQAKELARADRRDALEQGERAAIADAFDTSAPPGQPNSMTANVPLGKLPAYIGMNRRTVAQAAGAGPGGMSFDPEASQPLAVPTSDAAPQAQTAAPPPSPGLLLKPEGLRNIARFNPKLAMDLSKMDADQQAAAFKRVTDHVAFESQVIGSVRRVPEAERPAAYERIRADLEARGVQGLPPAWDEQDAEARMAMGMTVAQAFQDDRAERRLAWDIADDEADNNRADRNTNSVIEDRGARRGLVVRGQNMADVRGRRGQDMSSTDRRRGQDMVDKRARDGVGGNGGKAPAPGVAPPATAPTAGRTIVNPKTGQRMQHQGGKWVVVG